MGCEGCREGPGGVHGAARPPGCVCGGPGGRVSVRREGGACRGPSLTAPRAGLVPAEG